MKFIIHYTVAFLLSPAIVFFSEVVYLIHLIQLRSHLRLMDLRDVVGIVLQLIAWMVTLPFKILLAPVFYLLLLLSAFYKYRTVFVKIMIHVGSAFTFKMYSRQWEIKNDTYYSGPIHKP